MTQRLKGINKMSDNTRKIKRKRFFNVKGQIRNHREFRRYQYIMDKFRKNLDDLWPMIEEANIRYTREEALREAREQYDLNQRLIKEYFRQ